MQVKKLLISVVLLLSYSLGFTHNLIPHCEEVKDMASISVSKINASHQNFNHNHHQNTLEQNQNLDHEHISHQNHFDESMFDLAICFLNEMNSTLSDCNAEHCVLLKIDDNSAKVISTKYLVKAIFVNIQKTLKIVFLPNPEKQNLSSNQNELLPNSYRIRSNSLRAPPVSVIS